MKRCKHVVTACVIYITFLSWYTHKVSSESINPLSIVLKKIKPLHTKGVPTTSESKSKGNFIFQSSISEINKEQVAHHNPVSGDNITPEKNQFKSEELSYSRLRNKAAKVRVEQGTKQESREDRENTAINVTASLVRYAICMNSCFTNTSPWNSKCGWRECTHCEKCLITTNQTKDILLRRKYKELSTCSSNCDHLEQDWSMKCTWTYLCGGCQSCAKKSEAIDPIKKHELHRRNLMSNSGGLKASNGLIISGKNSGSKRNSGSKKNNGSKNSPTCNPTKMPTKMPLKIPTKMPSPKPVGGTTSQPMITKRPTVRTNPSDTPSYYPTASNNPSKSPSFTPSMSNHPSIQPSIFPSVSIDPSDSPSNQPSIKIDSTNSTCPPLPPTNENCTGTYKCYYGAETCCGETFPEFFCECIFGKIQCGFTDACLAAHKCMSNDACDGSLICKGFIHDPVSNKTTPGQCCLSPNPPPNL